MKSYLILISIVATVAATPDFDYCELNCQINGTVEKHIGCDNNGEFGPKCDPSVKMIPIDDFFKNLVLNKHNEIRNFIASGGNDTFKFKPACRMATVQWNDELAEYAALKAKTCVRLSEGCRRTKAFTIYGQNAYALGLNSKNTLEEALLEVIQDIFLLTHEVGNDYSDMFADRCISIGCAGNVYDYEFKNKTKNGYFLVCNYSTDLSPPEPLYAECEKAAEGCKHKSTEFPNLCALGEKYDE